MAAAIEQTSNDEISIVEFDPTLAARLINVLVENGAIKKNKQDQALEIVNGFAIKTPTPVKMPKQLADNKPNRDANLIKKLVPFTGKCIEGKCQALNNNHGLFNQCDKPPMGKGAYCKGCQSPNGTTGMTKIQTCGTVEDRRMQYEENGDINKYKTPSYDKENKDGDVVTKNGVWSKSLGKVLEDINKKRDEPIERHQIEEVAEGLDVEIPEECWEVPETKKGRKPGSKNSSKNSSPVSSDGEAEPKKRGRKPKKEVPEEEVVEEKVEISVADLGVSDDEEE